MTNSHIKDYFDLSVQIAQAIMATGQRIARIANACGNPSFLVQRMAA